jgi:manganese/zinc/iron transport system permease protein
MIELWNETYNLLTDYTVRNILTGSSLIGFLSGLVGTFSVLKKESLIGDTMSHSALPGIGVVFLLVGVKNLFFLVFGAGIFSLIGAYSVFKMNNDTKLANDTSLGVVMSSSFALGIVIISYISKTGRSSQAGLDNYIFGQAATIIWSDVLTFFVFTAIIVPLIILFYKEIKGFLFNKNFLEVVGANSKLVELLTTFLTVIVIILSVETVGIILMIALLVLPCVISRQWTNKFSVVLLLSGFIGLICSLIGSTLSILYQGVPTGPTIVLCLTFCLVLSLIFGVNGGYLYSLNNIFRNFKERGL